MKTIGKEPPIAAQMSGNVTNAASVMKTLSSEARIMLMCQLIDGEKSVNVLAEALEMRLPAISQHLAKMRASGLVSSRRDAQSVYYRANQGVGRAVIDTLCQHLRNG